MNWHLVLILIGGPTVMVAPPLVAAYLCERHSKQHGRAYAAKGEHQVATAEAVRRAAQRQKESIR